MFYQVLNISEGGILGAFGKRGPFGGCQLAFKTVEQPVDDGSLALVERLLGMSFPEMGLAEDACEDMFCSVKCAIKNILRISCGEYGRYSPHVGESTCEVLLHMNIVRGWAAAE